MTRRIKPKPATLYRAKVKLAWRGARSTAFYGDEAVRGLVSNA